jgi:hypothetical protein
MIGKSATIPATLINSLIAKEKERQAALRQSLGLFGG